MGKHRSMSICLSDIPKERITAHTNGKMYLNIQSYDMDKEDQYGNHFSLSLPLTDEEKEIKKNGGKVNRVFLGNGKIWEDTGSKPATQEQLDDLPF